MKAQSQLLAQSGTFFVLILAITGASLRAQVVNDGATQTLSNVTNTITGGVTVGTNGSFTLLVLSDNALLTSTGRGVIGANSTARSNEVRLVSPSARWLMGDTLFLGSNGAFSTLVVSNGARVDSGWAFFGFGTASSNNTAIITGAGSVWSNQLQILVGQQGGANRLLISDGGRVDCSNFVSVGAQSAANSDNEVLVSGANSTLNIRGGGLGVGATSSRNQLRIRQGGSVVAEQTSSVGGGGSSNTAIVTDPGSRWLAGTNILVGNFGAANRLVVSNGAWVEVGSASIGRGFGGNNNVVVVTGADSVWSNRADLFVGSVGHGNQLIVSNGATVLASDLFVGFDANSLANRVLVDSGTVRVTNVTGNGTLDIRRGTNVLNSGLVEVDRLLLTNSAGRFLFNGGTLSTRGTSVNNGQTFLVGNGTSATTFHLAGNGTHSVAAQWFIAAGATLTGNGNLSGVLVVGGGGTLAPGASIGKITLSTPPVLNGTTVMEISKHGGVLTHDQVQVMDAVSYSGALVVTHLGPDPLAAGDRFSLFPAGSYAGSFTSLTLPPLGPGIRWKNNLLADGSIEVESLAPSVTTLPASGVSQTNATLNGTAHPKGTDTIAWFEWGFTTNYGNVTPPQALGSGEAETNFSARLTGLIPDAPYHFRAVASNSFGVTLGADEMPVVAHPLTNVAWYRMGENDPGTVQPSAPVTNATLDVIGGKHLNPFNVPAYSHGRSVGPMQLGSSRSIRFNGTNQYVAGAVVSAATDNFGIELVASQTANAAGNHFIAYNGNTTLNGWGILQASNRFMGLLGGVTAVGPTVSSLLSTHLALVRNNGLTTFYVNGVAAGSTASAPNAPAGAFAIGARPNNPAEFFPGEVDEVRVFTFEPGQFSTNDLLFHVQRAVTLPATNIGSSQATLQGTVHPTGFPTLGWFVWGTGTGPSFIGSTPPRWLGSGLESISFSEVLPGLSSGNTYNFRVVVSNRLDRPSSLPMTGAARTFRTLGPSIQTLGASGVNGSTATLNGVSNPGGTPTSVWFEWGTTTNYGNVTPPQAVGSGTNNVNFSEVLTGLVAGAVYHFRAAGSNATGVAFGNDLTFPNLTPQAYLKASNTGSNDLFGFAVALSGNTLVVGARFESSSATGINGNQNNDTAVGSGAAYVFVRNGSNWTQQAYLKASNTESNDQFGTSVGISGDTIVVGARFESSSATGVNGNQNDNAAPSAGAAYVFARNGTNWTQQAYLKAGNTGAGDNFGQRLGISGDTIVVGAPLEDSSATGMNGDGGNDATADSGAAYVFVRNGTNWTQQAYLKAGNAGAGDVFGQFAAISGDTVVITANQEDSNATGINGDGSDNGATNSGAAYVFVRNGTNWTQQAYLKASNTDAEDRFGVSAAVSGDTVVVGADLEDGGASGVNGDPFDNRVVEAGAAYVFVRSGANWTQQAYLKAGNTSPSSVGLFGFGVAVLGDTVIVGGVGDRSNATGVNGDQSNNNSSDSGAAYWFERNGTNWTQRAYLKASNTGAGDLFGNAAAISEDMVVIGARQEDGNATGVNGNGSDNSESNSGAAYVFDFPQTTMPVLSIAPGGINQVTLSWTPPTPGFGLQQSLSLTPILWSNSPSGSTNPITLPLTESAQFFRLLKP